MMVKFYELNESEVLDSKLEPGTFICCKDSTNIYMVPTDPSEGTKPVKMGDTVKFLTEEQRNNLLAPINGKQYFAYDTGKMWIYFNDWICLNKDKGLEGAQFSFEPVTIVPGETTTIEAANSKATSKAEFIPNLNVIDLITLSNVNITCSNGSVTIEAPANMSYPITGKLLVTV